MTVAKIRVQQTAKQGEIITVKSLIKHKMESGQRKDESGQKIPRQIINSFVATYNDIEIISADWFPAVSANPFFSFKLKANETGPIKLQWVDDEGAITTVSATLTVQQD